MSGAQRMPVDLVALSRTGPVHFMGVGGAGMCALAEWLQLQGGAVSGCDLKGGASTARLAALGAEIMVGHDRTHVDEATALVYTSAVPAAHPELVRARERGIPVLKRAEALGALVAGGRVVAIAGTHGKTTTTALTVEVLTAAGLDPTGFVGGSVPAWGGNLRRGSDTLFVVEADEFDRSFHTLAPDVAVVTNLEADHLDIYGDVEGVRGAFREFVGRLRPGGACIVCADDPGAAALLPELPDAGPTYGLGAGTQLRAVDVVHDADGCRFRVIEHGVDRGEGRLRVPGDHTLRNALAAAAVARSLGADWDAIRVGWGAFEGVGRRFQPLGTAADVEVIDDYAHHPTEIRVTLEAVRRAHPSRRLVAVFQPHLYSRTRDFAAEFGSALAVADRVWVTDVFPAREEPIEGVDGTLVVAAAERAGADVGWEPSLDRLPGRVAEDLGAGDVVVTMGAGSIEATGPALLALLEARVHA
jgi:UDP-N-acetylmuramate--alanine ligase